MTARVLSRRGARRSARADCAERPGDWRHHLPPVLAPENGRDRLLRGERQRAGERLWHSPDESPQGVRVREGEHDPPHHLCRQQRRWLLPEAGVHQGRHDGAGEVGGVHQDLLKKVMLYLDSGHGPGKD